MFLWADARFCKDAPWHVFTEADAHFMFLDLKICSGAMICADYVQGVAPIETQ
jgi:hypothetical protein